MTLGEMSVADLIKSAQRETINLGKRLDELIEFTSVSAFDAGILRAYIESVHARLVVAESKLLDDETLDVLAKAADYMAAESYPDERRPGSCSHYIRVAAQAARDAKSAP